MTTYKGTIAKKPIVKDKVIFSAIRIPNADRPIQLVLFKSTVDKSYADLLATLTLNDEITVAGKEQKSKLNNETEISVAEIYLGDNEPTKSINLNNPFAEYSISDSDLVAGNETKYGQIRKEGNPLKEKIYFTDGEHYWYEDSKMKTPCVF
jgi:hypothetical protein